jgi:hypothetical protein
MLDAGTICAPPTGFLKALKVMAARSSCAHAAATVSVLICDGLEWQLSGAAITQLNGRYGAQCRQASQQIGNGQFRREPTFRGLRWNGLSWSIVPIA